MSEKTAPQWFDATSGRVSGIAGLVAASILVLSGAVSRSAGWTVVGLIIGLGVWLVLLRPRVGLEGRNLLLRGVFSTTVIPLSQVTSMVVRQVFAVWVGEKRYISAALGRPLREVRPRRGQEVHPDPYLEHILELIRAHQADAKRWGGDAPVVRRHWAPIEIGAALVLLTAVALLVLI